MMGSGNGAGGEEVISTAESSGNDPGHRVIKGRRWRITDPSIPEPLRQALVDELMSARRAVGAGGRADDPEAVARARARVQDAKVALGERGPRWWLPRGDDDHRVRAIAATRALLRSGGTSRTPRPADVARVVDGARWRRRLALVKTALSGLADAGEIDLLRGGERVDGPVRGAVSLAPGARFPAPSARREERS